MFNSCLTRVWLQAQKRTSPSCPPPLLKSILESCSSVGLVVGLWDIGVGMQLPTGPPLYLSLYHCYLDTGRGTFLVEVTGNIPCRDNWEHSLLTQLGTFLIDPIGNIPYWPDLEHCAGTGLVKVIGEHFLYILRFTFFINSCPLLFFLLKWSPS